MSTTIMHSLILIIFLAPEKTAMLKFLLKKGQLAGRPTGWPTIKPASRLAVADHNTDSNFSCESKNRSRKTTEWAVWDWALDPERQIFLHRTRERTRNKSLEERQRQRVGSLPLHCMLKLLVMSLYPQTPHRQSLKYQSVMHQCVWNTTFLLMS